MRLNADFSKRAISIESAGEWIGSPESGVERRMLDRIGDEVARATSIVRYAPASSFPSHTHAKGEEFLVLDGVFSDERDSYPAGTYVRNPPGSAHKPYSTDGCRILVKLRQFRADDLAPIVVDTTDGLDWQTDERSGGDLRRLHNFGTERVSMLRFKSGHDISIDVKDGGLEWLLLGGSLRFDSSDYGAESWFRFPAGDSFKMKTADNCQIWQKTGHLPCG